MKSNYDKTAGKLFLGAIAGGVMMLISYLMDGYGLMDEVTALSYRPISVYTFCLIAAMIGVPAMCIALEGWYQIVRSVHARRWVRLLYCTAALSYAVSTLYIIAIDCLPPTLYQSMLSSGASAEVAFLSLQKAQEPFTIPIIVFFLLEDIGVSIVLWQLILSGKLQLPKWMLMFCPVVTLIFDVLIKLIPLAITKDMSVTLESFGWLLFMLAGLVHIKRVCDRHLDTCRKQGE